MTRRSFFSSMIAAGVAATLDTDQLLWTPGKTHISIPATVKPKVVETLGKVKAYTFTIEWQVAPVLPPDTQEWFDKFTSEYFAAPGGQARHEVVSRWTPLPAES